MKQVGIARAPTRLAFAAAAVRARIRDKIFGFAAG
jgi:hypothetical protein